MRMLRFRTNPALPFFSTSRRAKKPATRKNRVMRKLWATKAASASSGLVELSAIAHSPGGHPGMKDRAAWKATPSSRANPRTASSACRRCGSRAFMAVSSEEVAAACGGDLRQEQGENEDDGLREQDPGHGVVPDRHRAGHVAGDAGQGADHEHEDAHRHVGDDDH